MSIIYQTGDLFEGIQNRAWAQRPVLIPHVCNDLGAWGKGFVYALSGKWSAPQSAYHAWHHGSWRARYEPGRYEIATSATLALGHTQFITANPANPDSPWPRVVVANMIAQQGVRAPGNMIPLRYPELGACLEQVAHHAVVANARVVMPRIGAGLAGGDWARIEPLINDTLIFCGIPTTVYTLP